MMAFGNPSIMQPLFLSWNLRNIVDNSPDLTAGGFGLIGTRPGEYPIEGWDPYLLEVPRDGMRRDISGRFSDPSNIGVQNLAWDLQRTVNLPVYINSNNADKELLKIIIRNWNELRFPEDIPCFALAVKCHSNYTDVREAQCVNVLLIWNDEVCRIMTLDWYEGPEEDCITPEWYINTTPLLNLEDAFARMNESYRKSQWENPVYSIFTVPSCLGCALTGEICEGPRNLWDNEWKYRNHSELSKDLDQLLISIQEIFSYEEVR